jgi:hypothetical protein
MIMTFFKSREQEGYTYPVWALVLMGGGGYKERVKEENMVEMLCTDV